MTNTATAGRRKIIQDGAFMKKSQEAHPKTTILPAFRNSSRAGRTPILSEDCSNDKASTEELKRGEIKPKSVVAMAQFNKLFTLKPSSNTQTAEIKETLATIK